MATDTSKYGVVIPAPKGYKGESRSPAFQRASDRPLGVSLGRLMARAGVKASMFRKAQAA